MKIKKILTLILCVAMVLSTMGISTFSVSADGATSTVVEVSTNEALVLALSEGNNVKITDNFTVDTRITVPDGAVIDLNEKTLNWNVENSYFGECTVKNGNIVLGKDDVHVCDGYFLVNEGKTLTVEDVNITSSDEGIKCYAVFHLKTGASLDLKNSTIDVANNEYAGSVVYAGEATAKFDATDSTVIGINVGRGVVHATTVIEDSIVTFKGTTQNGLEHGFNRSALTIKNSTVTITGGTGRGITSEHGDLVIDGDSAVTVYDMTEATIELRNDKSMTVSDSSTVIVDTEVNNTTTGTVTGTVTVQKVPMGTITPAYTSATSIWGEAWGNASAGEQFEIKVYSGKKLIATAALTEHDNLKDGDVYVTWTIPTDLTNHNDPYWELSWEEGMPASNYQPTHADLWVDGEKVATNNAQMNGPDNLNEVEWKDDPTTDTPAVSGVAVIPTVEVTFENNDIMEFDSLQSAINMGYSSPKKEIKVNDDISEEITALYGNIVSGNVNGVAITGTSTDWVYADDALTLGENVAFSTEALFVSDAEADIKGDVITENLYVADDATVSVYAPGSITVNGAAHYRRNENLTSGLYIYGDGDDTTVEYRSTYYSGIYSGIFYAKDATVEMGYVLLKNSYDTDYGTVKMEHDNSKLTVIGTQDNQNSFQIDGSAELSLTNNTKIKDVRDFNILADTNLTLLTDDTSTISATNVSVAEGVPFEAVDNGDGTWGIKKILLGAGTQENPFLINNLEDLLIFADNVNNGTSYNGKIVKLTTDIDLNNEEWTPIGNSTNKFQGTFDGDNHTISNLLITGNNSNAGLFGFTTNGEIKNLTVNNAKVSGRLNVGVVAGTPYTSKYTNINVIGHVEVNGMSYVGGVGGKNAYANWEDITVNVDDTSYVKANSVENGTAYRTYIGGVIGFCGEGGHSFTNITSNIDVIGSTCDVGGITGIAHYGNKFINCSSSGDIYVEDANENEIGGIAGVWNNGGSPVIFENCSFTGKTYIAGEEVEVSISGPSYNNTGNGKLTIKGKVELNGAEKENLHQALSEAKGMTEPAVIDLLGNSATIDKAHFLNNDITFKNGILVFDSFNGKNPDTYDPAGIYCAVMTIGAKVTFDDVILTGKDVEADAGVFVLGTNGVMSLTNGSELNVTAPTATAVIYSEGTGKLIVNDSDINIDGAGIAVRGMLSLEIDSDNAEINIENITDNAMRNVKGTVDNSTITVDGAEFGIKNNGECDTLTVRNSNISVINTSNDKDGAGIYLANREKLADENSIINAQIYVEENQGYTSTLNFETNGGNIIGTVEKNQGEVVELAGYRPEKSGYTFDGWCIDETLTQDVTSVTLDAPTIVYAKWRKSGMNAGGGFSIGNIKYTITFKTNGGTDVNKVSVEKNTNVDLLNYVSEKEGYTFDGWYSDKELTNKVTSVKLTENITLYAKWTEIEKEPSTTGDENWFDDVNATDWFYENVKYVVENELMNGVSEDKFAPNDTLTRAMLVTVLYRLEGEPDVWGGLPFEDVEIGSYYEYAVAWAKQNGIVNGVTETEFAPNYNITREQIASIIHRYAEYKGYDVSAGETTNILSHDDFEDISEYAMESMQYAVGSGLLRGKTEATLNPKDNATRAEIAAILQRFIEANN